MFDRNSRYYNIEKVFHSCQGGKRIVYVRRRFIPKVKRDVNYPTLTWRAGDRLDLIAERLLSDSEKFWRICDVNYVLNPRMYNKPGKLVNIPIEK
jgi:hypothetical protein